MVKARRGFGKSHVFFKALFTRKGFRVLSWLGVLGKKFEQQHACGSLAKGKNLRCPNHLTKAHPTLPPDHG